MKAVTASQRRFVQAGVLAVWGAVCVGFFATGRIASYLHPSFHGWTLVCGMVLLIVAAAITFFPAPEEGHCGHDHDPHHDHEHDDHDCGGAHAPQTARGLLLSTAILVVPLLGAVVVSPSEFGAVAVQNRGLATSIVDLPGASVSAPFREPPLPTADGSIGAEGDPVDAGLYLARNDQGDILASPVDLLYAAHVPEMRPDFEGRRIEVVGQFFPATRNNPEGDRFSLVRMFVLCCAADARPVAVTVRTAVPEDFPKMSWIKVTGTATFPVEGGERVPVIEADAIEPTEMPPESFLY